MHFEYMKPESGLTLAEGLEEYYRGNRNLLMPEELSEDAAGMFRRHDAGHVVFACDTSLFGETLIDTWTVVATTAGLRGYLEYFRYPQVNRIFSEVGMYRVGLESLKASPAMMRAVIRGWKQPMKWPWYDYEQFLQTPLIEIREHFGIRVILP